MHLTTPLDLCAYPQMLKISDTILQPGMLEFTLMQLTGLTQGPNAATARSLMPDVFTLLLWSVDRCVQWRVHSQLPQQYDESLTIAASWQGCYVHLAGAVAVTRLHA